MRSGRSHRLDCIDTANSSYHLYPLSDNLKSDAQADIVNALKKTSRHVEDILNLDNPYFDTMVTLIYSKELTLNKDNHSDGTGSF